MDDATGLQITPLRRTIAGASGAPPCRIGPAIVRYRMLDQLQIYNVLSQTTRLVEYYLKVLHR